MTEEDDLFDEFLSECEIQTIEFTPFFNLFINQKLDPGTIQLFVFTAVGSSRFTFFQGFGSPIRLSREASDVILSVRYRNVDFLLMKLYNAEY